MEVTIEESSEVEATAPAAPVLTVDTQPQYSHPYYFAERRPPGGREVEVKSRLTIAYRRVGHELRFGIAVCSHNDMFCKKVGRELAIERLQGSPNIIPMRDSRIAKQHAEDTIAEYLTWAAQNDVLIDGLPAQWVAVAVVSPVDYYSISKKLGLQT